MFDSSESCRPTPAYSTVTINLLKPRRMLFSARSAASIWKRGSSVEVGAFSARVTDIRNSSGPYFAHGDAATPDRRAYTTLFQHWGRSALRLSDLWRRRYTPIARMGIRDKPIAPASP